MDKFTPVFKGKASNFIEAIEIGMSSLTKP